MMKIYLIIFLFINTFIFSQIKGKIVDTNNQPISFVSIAVENENIGATSEENGDFIINTSGKNKNLVFSALGFEKKIIAANAAQNVVLTPSLFQLNEVVIVKKYGTKTIEIGKTDNRSSSAFDNGPKIDAKYFPYLYKYKKTPFIKQVAIQTDSKIENASFKIHFYGVDVNGFPGNELLLKNFIVTVNSGIKKTLFNLTDYNLKMPQNGIFVAFEKLIIEKNKLERNIISKNTDEVKIQKIYFPWVLYNYVERDFLFTFSGGKWSKQSREAPNKIMLYEPAIHLVLSN